MADYINNWNKFYTFCMQLFVLFIRYDQVVYHFPAAGSFRIRIDQWKLPICGIYQRIAAQYSRAITVPIHKRCFLKNLRKNTEYALTAWSNLINNNAFYRLDNGSHSVVRSLIIESATIWICDIKTTQCQTCFPYRKSIRRDYQVKQF